MLLPASSATKRGPIKRSVDTRALSLSIRELQLCLPGSWQDYAAQGQAAQSALVQEFFQAKGFDVQVGHPPFGVHLGLPSSCSTETLYHLHKRLPALCGASMCMFCPDSCVALCPLGGHPLHPERGISLPPPQDCGWMLDPEAAALLLCTGRKLHEGHVPSSSNSSSRSHESRTSSQPAEGAGSALALHDS